MKLTVALTLILLSTASAAAATELPDASFGFFPRLPLAGEQVRFASYACDPGGVLVGQQWDLDGDGSFDDASGRVVRRSFPNGTYRVGLLATNADGETTTSTQTVVVYSGTPRDRGSHPFVRPRLRPWPVIRLAGVVTRHGARISLLTVNAPVCSSVTVRCRGGTCPVKRASGVAGRHVLRFHQFDRARLAAGVKLDITVRKPDRVGKHTQFRIMRGKPPARTDKEIAP